MQKANVSGRMNLHWRGGSMVTSGERGHGGGTFASAVQDSYDFVGFITVHIQ